MSPGARNAVIAAGAILVVLAVLQVVLPWVASRRAEDRLTASGGSAEVSVRSWPAVRLLLGGDGDSLRVRAREIDLDDTRAERPLRRLDGFRRVDVLIEDSAAGPLDLRSVRISRIRGGAYRLQVDAAVAPRDLARYVGSRLGAIGGLLGGLAGGSIPLGDEPVPLALDAMVESENGRARVVAGAGSIAGVPLGPLADLIVGAVAARI